MNFIKNKAQYATYLVSKYLIKYSIFITLNAFGKSRKTIGIK